MDNIAPSGPQPVPSDNDAVREPFAFDGEAADLPVTESASPSQNPVVEQTRDVAQQVEDFMRDRPLACMAIALVAGVGLAAVAVSLGRASRPAPYGRWS